MENRNSIHTRRQLAHLGLGAGLALIANAAVPKRASAKGNGIQRLLAAANRKAQMAGKMADNVANKQRSLVREMKSKNAKSDKAVMLTDQQSKSLVQLTKTLRDMEKLLAEAGKAMEKDCA